MSTQQMTRTGQNQGGVANKQTLGALFAANQAEMSQVAANGLSAERLYRTMLQCISKSEKLKLCSAESLLRAMYDALEVGIEPGGAMGLAYLVPYGTSCEYQIGYRGYIELARRSGFVNHVHPVAVYKGDTFEFEMGLNPILKHKPGIGARVPKDLTHVYAIAHFKDGPPQFDVMTRGEIDAIMARSKSANNGPWQTDYAEMAKKTVLRRICKVLPRSIAVRDNLSVAADGRLHRIETPIITADFRPDMSDDEFEPAAASSAPPRQSSPKGPTAAEMEAELFAALTIQSARIIPLAELDLSAELLSRILDRTAADLEEEWAKMDTRDHVRVLCYAMDQGKCYKVTEEIPDPAATLARAEAFMADAA